MIMFTVRAVLGRAARPMRLWLRVQSSPRAVCAPMLVACAGSRRCWASPVVVLRMAYRARTTGLRCWGGGLTRSCWCCVMPLCGVSDPTYAVSGPADFYKGTRNQASVVRWCAVRAVATGACTFGC